MLVLTRKKNESVMIGELVKVSVVEIRRGIVRLGFDAPLEVPVHRQEVFDAIQKANGENREDAA